MTAGDKPRYCDWFPADSALAGQYSADATPQTAEQIATGRELGADIAAQLVEADVLKKRFQEQGWVN